MCCGAGTAADCDKVTKMIGSQLKLNRLNWGRQVRVKTANHLFKQMLFRYQGHIGAYLVLAGADVDGGHLYTIHAHGSTDKIPYTAMGSGTCFINKYQFELLVNIRTPEIAIFHRIFFVLTRNACSYSSIRKWLDPRNDRRRG